MAEESRMDTTDASMTVAEVGPVTAQEAGLRTDARRFRVVAIVAGVLLIGPVIAQLWYSLSAIPTYASLFSSMGGEVPPATSALFGIGPWMGLLFVVVDALVFWGFYRMARRYWIGLLFAPLFAVPMITAAIMIPMLYLPMTDVITLVK